MPLYHVNYSFNSSSSNDTAGHVFETPALNGSTVQVSESVYLNTNHRTKTPSLSHAKTY